MARGRTIVPREALTSEGAWDTLRRRFDLWKPVLEVIAHRHGLGGEALSLVAPGSAVVACAGEGAMIKIYHPDDGLDRDREARVFEVTAGRLPAATPAVLGRGEVEACPYLLMTRLAGQELDQVWNRLDGEESLALMSQLADFACALHELPVAEPGPLQIDWQNFLARQLASAEDRQRRRGLPEPWLVQIEPFLSRFDLRAGGAPPTSLLHTELMRGHLLVTFQRGWPRLSGVFDFAESFLGAPEYELPSVGLFVSAGEPALLGEFLRAYGLPADEIGPGLSHRLLAWTLCHRYAHLPWYMSRMPPPASVSRLEALALHWFSL